MIIIIALYAKSSHNHIDIFYKVCYKCLGRITWSLSALYYSELMCVGVCFL